jgi:hypothetical protein
LKAITAILVAMIASATITYLLLHHKVNRLQTENQGLIAQPENPPSNQNPVPQEISETRTSQTDPDEILRLRREVAILSQQTNEMEQALQAETLSFHARQLSQRAKNAAGGLVLVIRVYTADFGNDLMLTNLDQFKTLVRDGSYTNLDLENFEIVSNPAPWNTNSPDAIVLRERTPRQTADGQWARVYGLVDGSVTEQISANGYFDPWEKEHLMPPRRDP